MAQHLGGISAFGRDSIGTGNFSGKRVFTGSLDGKPLQKTVRGNWDISFVSLDGGISGEGGGSRFFFRPAVTVDYVRLKEKGVRGKGRRNPARPRRRWPHERRAAINSGLTLGVDFYGNRKGDENWLRLETEGGWREIVSGGLGTPPRISRMVLHSPCRAMGRPADGSVASVCSVTVGLRARRRDGGREVARGRRPHATWDDQNWVLERFSIVLNR